MDSVAHALPARGTAPKLGVLLGVPTAFTQSTCGGDLALIPWGGVDLATGFTHFTGRLTGPRGRSRRP